MKCPQCKHEFDQVYEVHTQSKEPFTAVSAFEGLTAYGPYDISKELVCHAGDYVHIRFADGENRLIRMLDFSLKNLSEKHQAHENSPLPCEHEGCTHDGIPCYIQWIDENPAGWFCEEHAPEEGFCYMCGLFSAGTEAFDFAPHGYAGLCEGCQEALHAEFDEDEDDYDDFDGYDDW